MVGREVELGRRRDEVELGEVVLEARGLVARGDRGVDALRDVSLTVRAGEVLGVAGVAGNGQRELAEALTGLRRLVSGTVEVAGRRLASGDPRSAIRAGVAHVPEDRLHTGVAPSLSIASNVVLKSYRGGGVTRGPFLLLRRIRDRALELIRRYDVRTPGPTAPARHALGRQPAEGRPRPRVLRATARCSSPPRRLGGSTSARSRRCTAYLRDAAADGVGVLLISEDLDEVLALSDRIVVMYEGAIAGEVDGAGGGRRRARAADGGCALTRPAVRIEKRLVERRWLSVAVPLGSLAVAFGAIAIVLAATGHPPLATFRRLFDAAFLADGALSNTLISATPLAFTGLAAAVAFRMRLFNIGAEGQLYFGAIGAAGAAIYLDGQSTLVIVAAMIVVGAARGAAWGAIPGLLRAFAHTNEIITSLMLNYVAALVLNYLIFDSLSYWRDTSPTGAVFPQGKQLVDASYWPVSTLGSLVGPVRRARRDRGRVRRLGALLAHAVRVRGAGDRRLAAGRALRRDADATEDRRRAVPLGRDRRNRRREPDGGLPPRARRARPPAGELRLHRDRRRRARALQPVRRGARRIPARWARRTPATRCRAPTSPPGSSA